MRAILPLIPLLLSLVPLSCASFLVGNPRITCERALEALKAPDEFRNPKKESPKPGIVYSMFWWFLSFFAPTSSTPTSSASTSSAPTYSCLRGDTLHAKSSGSITYMLQDNTEALYLLKLNWNRDIENPMMVDLWDWAQYFSEIKEHSGLLRMPKFVKNRVDADGNPVEFDSVETHTPTWFVYYTLLEHGARGTLADFLTMYPFYSKNVPWVGQTFLKIAKAVAYLHGIGKVHSEIGLDNVVLDADLNPKLFVSNKPAKKGIGKTFNGLAYSVAPEVLAAIIDSESEKNFIWSQKQDTYALGVLLYQMLYDQNFPFVCVDVSIPDPALPGSVSPDLPGPVFPNLPDLPAQDTQPLTRAQALELKTFEKTKIESLLQTISKGIFQVRSGITFRLIMVLHGCLQSSDESRWEDLRISEEFEAFSDIWFNPNNFPPFEVGSLLTVDTRIKIPEDSPANTITISTELRLKEPEAFESQDIKVLDEFRPEDPLFLYEPKLDRQFKLVR